LQVHRLAIATGHGCAVLEPLERGVEQPHGSSQLVQVGAGRNALGARGFHAQQCLGRALGQHALAPRQVDAHGVLRDLERGVEVENQNTQVEQQEQRDRDDDLAVLAEREAALAGSTVCVVRRARLAAWVQRRRALRRSWFLPAVACFQAATFST
jgi:hypothetical protein